ncbi:hypothetical protein NUSPORA_01436 [Nucleospora cyclopteri]
MNFYFIIKSTILCSTQKHVKFNPINEVFYIPARSNPCVISIDPNSEILNGSNKVKENVFCSNNRIQGHTNESVTFLVSLRKHLTRWSDRASQSILNLFKIIFCCNVNKTSVPSNENNYD